MASNKNDDQKKVSVDDELESFLKPKNKNSEKEIADKDVVEDKIEKKSVKEASGQKDFLSSLVSEDKPASFQEEEVTRVEKKSFQLSKQMINIGVVSLITLIALIYFMFFAANATMPDFLGDTKNDVQVWMRQNSINATDVILVEEYNFEYEAGQVVSQSVSPNKRFRKGAKITIVVSKGADPEEAISFPDIKNMTYNEIVAWRTENKLLNLRINQVYHDSIENGEVISYDLRNVAENEFKRGTNITIEVSRGKQPVQQVTVQDFTGKTLPEIQAWADSNKVKLEVNDSFTSDDGKAGRIASQSPSTGSIDQGSTIIVNVYKHAATMVNLVGGTTTNAQSWCSSNGVSCNFIEQYHDSVLPNRVVSQSIGSGRIVDASTPVNIYISIGRVDILEFNGKSITELRNWVEDKNSKLAGLNLQEQIIYDNDPCKNPTGELQTFSFPTDPSKYGYLKYGDSIYAIFYVNSADPSTCPPSLPTS